MDDNKYIDKLIQRLKIEKNENSVKTIILSLAYTVSDKGQKAINEYYSNSKNLKLKDYTKKYCKLETKNDLPKTKIKSKRDQFSKFLTDFSNRNYDSKDYDFETYSKEVYYLVKKSDYQKIKQLRKNAAQRVSDEALSEINFLTMLLQYAYTSEE
jgi:hypothetical protein